MNCRICGSEIQAEEQQCSKCREMDSNVQVLNPNEIDNFNGITIEQEPADKIEGNYERRDSNANQRIYVKHVNFTSTKSSLFTMLLIAIILLVLVFVALPIAIFFIGIIAPIWYFLRR